MKLPLLRVSDKVSIDPSKVVSITKSLGRLQEVRWYISDGHFMHDVLDSNLTAEGKGLCYWWEYPVAGVRVPSEWRVYVEGLEERAREREDELKRVVRECGPDYEECWQGAAEVVRSMMYALDMFKAERDTAGKESTLQLDIVNAALAVYNTHPQDHRCQLCLACDSLVKARQESTGETKE